jgi:hypothetical protein
VKTGSPNGENLPKWMPLDPNESTTMALGARSGPRPIAPKERLRFYRELLQQ